MGFFAEHGGEVLMVVTSVVTAASIMANWTKTDIDNQAIGWVSKLINLLALNIKK